MARPLFGRGATDVRCDGLVGPYACGERRVMGPAYLRDRAAEFMRRFGVGGS